MSKGTGKHPGSLMLLYFDLRYAPKAVKQVQWIVLNLSSQVSGNRLKKALHFCKG
jgi:hypothetical protein